MPASGKEEREEDGAEPGRVGTSSGQVECGVAFTRHGIAVFKRGSSHAKIAGAAKEASTISTLSSFLERHCELSSCCGGDVAPVREVGAASDTRSCSEKSCVVSKKHDETCASHVETACCDGESWNCGRAGQIRVTRHQRRHECILHSGENWTARRTSAGGGFEQQASGCKISHRA